MPKGKKRIKAEKEPGDSICGHVKLSVIERVDKLVKLDRTQSRSEFVRIAVKKHLQEMEAELEEFLEAKKNFKD